MGSIAQSTQDLKEVLLSGEAEARAARIAEQLLLGSGGQKVRVTQNDAALLFGGGKQAVQVTQNAKILLITPSHPRVTQMLKIYMIGGLLNAPVNLQADALSQTALGLRWVDCSNNEDGFEIERAPTYKGPWLRIGKVGENAQEYMDAGLNPSTTYFYRVRAYHSVEADYQYSLYSNIARASTWPRVNAPMRLRARAISTSQINLRWNDAADSEDGFTVERAPDELGPWDAVTTVGENVTRYSDVGLKPGTTYYYRVYAHWGGGLVRSGYSNVAWAATFLEMPEASQPLERTTVAAMGVAYHDWNNTPAGVPTRWMHISGNSIRLWPTPAKDGVLIVYGYAQTDHEIEDDEEPTALPAGVSASILLDKAEAELRKSRPTTTENHEIVNLLLERWNSGVRRIRKL